MEERVELELEPAPESTPAEAAQAEFLAQTASAVPAVLPESGTETQDKGLAPAKKKKERVIR